VQGSCECGNEPSGSIKRWEVLEWLHNWHLLRKGSAPRVSERNAYFLPSEVMGPRINMISDAQRYEDVA
jgi:hypothetical protein